MAKYVEFTEYITPDNLTYRFDTRTDKFLISESGLGMPPIEYITQRGPYQHGHTIIDYRLGPRVIQMLHRRNGCSRIEYWNNRADLLNFLRPNRQTLGTFYNGTLRKVLPDGSKRDIDVMIEQGPVFEPRDPNRWDEWGFTETLRFIASDPTFYDPTAICTTWGLSTSDNWVLPWVFGSAVSGGITYTGLLFGSLIINNDVTITYTGTWMTYPSISITGPIEGADITNTTTGEHIKLDYFIPSGITVTISLQYGNKTVVDNNGQNLIGSVTADSDLATFHIAADPEAAGGVNVINATGVGAQVGTTEIALSYYTRYIGI